MRTRRCHIPVVVVVAQLLSEAASSYGSRSPMWRRRWLAADALLTVGDVTFRPRRRDKPHARPPHPVFRRANRVVCAFSRTRWKEERSGREIHRATDKEKTSGHNPERREEAPEQIKPLHCSQPPRPAVLFLLSSAPFLFFHRRLEATPKQCPSQSRGLPEKRRVTKYEIYYNYV